jgi:hypothetical protein
VEWPEFEERFKSRHKAWFGGMEVRETPKSPKESVPGPLKRTVEARKEPVLPLDAKARASGEVEEREAPEDFENE